MSAKKIRLVGREKRRVLRDGHVVQVLVPEGVLLLSTRLSSRSVFGSSASSEAARASRAIFWSCLV